MTGGLAAELLGLARWSATVVLALGALLASCVAHPADRTAPRVIEGGLDARGWDFATDGPLALAGEWRVAWGVLADRAAHVPGPKSDRTVKVPGILRDSDPPPSWRDETGEVTFLLDLEGLPLDPPLALSFGPLFPTESTCVTPEGVAVSGGLNGRPFDSSHESIAPYALALPRSPSLHCTVSMFVAPWHAHGGAGLWTAPLLASSKGALEHHDDVNIRFTAAAALLVTLAVFFIAQWLLRRSDREPLAVALFMLFCAIWFAGFAHIWDSWAWLSAPWRKRLEFSAVPALGSSGLLMTHALLREPWRRASTFAAALGGASVAALLVGPLAWLHRLLTVAQVLTLTLILALSSVALTALRRSPARAPDARLLVAGLLLPAAMGTLEIVLSVLTSARFGLTLVGVVGLALTLAFVLARRNAFARRSAESFAAATRRFVPLEFLAALGHQDVTTVSLGDASVRELTVLFADIRGFTTLSEHLSAEETFGLLNKLLSRAAPHIRAHGGFVDKYIGDAVMALFPGSPETAVHAAVAMQVAIARSRDLSVGESPVALGVGIHVGRVMMGTIGEAERFEATVISDAVNLTARLESLTKQFGCSVLVSEEVHATLGEDLRAHTRRLGTFLVKGKAQPVTIHEVFASDSAPVREAKAATRARFEAMLEAFAEGRVEAALAIAGELRDGYPDDGPANWWFMRLVKESTTGDDAVPWSRGIVRLDEK